jgi:hypothetical protein
VTIPASTELAAPVYFTLMTKGQATTRSILRVAIPVAVAGAALGLAWFLFRPKK